MYTQEEIESIKEALEVARELARKQFGFKGGKK